MNKTRSRAGVLHIILVFAAAIGLAIGSLFTPLALLAPAQAADMPSTTSEWLARNKTLKDWDTLQSKLASPEQISWLFTGDSITHGAQTSGGLHRYSEYINQYFHTTKINGVDRSHDLVMNTGVGNSTTRYLNEQFKVSVTDKHADVVSIALGMNDSANSPAKERVEIATFQKNLESFVDQIRKMNAIPILQTQNYPTDGRHTDFDKYEDVIRSIAIAKDVILIDINCYWKDAHPRNNSDGWMTNDGVHPQAQGYMEWAKFVLKQLDVWEAQSELARTKYAFVEKSGTAPLVAAAPLAAEVLEGKPNYEPTLNYSVATSPSQTVTVIKHDDDATKISQATNLGLTFRFKTTSAEQTGTIVAFSDAQSNKQIRVDLVAGGKLKVNRQLATGKFDGFTSNTVVADNKFHTISINSGDGTLVLSVDGVKTSVNYTNNDALKGANSLAFNGFSVDEITIGAAREDNGTTSNAFGGVIDYVAVSTRYITDQEISEQAAAVQSIDIYQSLKALLHNAQAKAANTWVFLGGSTLYGSVGDVSAKSATEVFDEVVRWECNGSSSCDTNTLGSLRLEPRSRFVVNSSFAGQTTADMVKDFDKRVGRYNAQALYIAPDVLKSDGTAAESVEEYQTNLATIISKAKEKNMVVVVVTPPEENTNAQPYATAAIKAAKDANVGLIDAYDYFQRLKKANSDADFTQLFTDGQLNHKGQLLLGKYLLAESGIGVISGKPIAALNYYDPTFPVTDPYVPECFDGAVECNKALNERNASKDLADLRKKLASNDAQRWVFAGDSITHGVLYADGLRHYSEYVNGLLHDIDYGLDRPRDRVVNTGNSAATTKLLKEGYSDVVGEKDPDIVFLTYGMNDARRTHNAWMPLDQFINNINEAIDKVRKDGAIPVLQTTNYTRVLSGNYKADNQWLNIYYQALRDIAAQKNVILIDFADYWQTDLNQIGVNDATLMGQKGMNDLHPGKQGHLAWAQYIARVLDTDKVRTGAHIGEQTALDKLDSAAIPDNNANSVVTLGGVTDACYSRAASRGANALLDYSVGKYFTGANAIKADDDAGKVANLASYSVAVRFKASADHGGTLISFSDKDSGKKLSLRILKKGETNAGKLRVNRDFGKGDDGFSGGAVTNGEWHTAVAVVTTNGENGTVRVNLDGKWVVNVPNLNGTSSMQNLPLTKFSVDHVTLGAANQNGTLSDYFTGAIDYVQVYGKALSDSEVAALASGGSDDSAALNVAAWVNNTAPNTWAFLGADTIYGDMDLPQTKNAVEVFEQVMRYNHNRANSTEMNRRKVVTNDGQLGFTSKDLLDRYHALEPNMTDVVYVVPDAVVAGKAVEGLDIFKSNIKALADEIKDDGHTAVLVTPANLDSAAQPYAQAIKEITDTVDVGLIDLHGYLTRANVADPDVQTNWFDTRGIANYRGQLAIGKYLYERSGLTNLSDYPNAMQVHNLHYDYSAGSGTLPQSITGGALPGERDSYDYDAAETLNGVVTISDVQVALDQLCYVADDAVTVYDVTDSDNPQVLAVNRVSKEADGRVKISGVDKQPHKFQVRGAVSTGDATSPKMSVLFDEFLVKGIAKPFAPTFIDADYAQGEPAKFTAPKASDGVSYTVSVKSMSDADARELTADQLSAYVPAAGDIVTVAATAEENYVLDADSAWQWSHTYSSPSQYTVTFNTNGGSSVPVQTIREGSFAKAPEAPAKSGYTFAGWFKDTQLTESFNFDSDKVSADTVLYACWIKDTDPTEPDVPAKPTDPTEPDTPVNPEHPVVPVDRDGQQDAPDAAKTPTKATIARTGSYSSAILIASISLVFIGAALVSRHRRHS